MRSCVSETSSSSEETELNFYVHGVILCVRARGTRWSLGRRWILFRHKGGDGVRFKDKSFTPDLSRRRNGASSRPSLCFRSLSRRRKRLRVYVNRVDSASCSKAKGMLYARLHPRVLNCRRRSVATPTRSMTLFPRSSNKLVSPIKKGTTKIPILGHAAKNTISWHCRMKMIMKIRKGRSSHISSLQFL